MYAVLKVVQVRSWVPARVRNRVYNVQIIEQCISLIGKFCQDDLSSEVTDASFSC